MVHVVLQHENLSKVAAKYGFPDYKWIYYAECNRHFRQIRPNPDHIRAGDRFEIPPNPRQLVNLLSRQIMTLKKLRVETVKTFAELHEQAEQNFKSYEGTAQNIEAAKTVADILFALGKIVKLGLKSTKVVGEELERINHEAGKAAGELATDKIKETFAKETGKRLAKDPNTGIFAVLIQSIDDIQNPNFWGVVITNLKQNGWNRAVTTTPQDLQDEVVRNIDAQQNRTLSQLDQSIARLQRRLGQLNDRTMGTLYNLPNARP